MMVGGQLAGNLERIVISASTPPVDEPMAITRPSEAKLRLLGLGVARTSRGWRSDFAAAFTFSAS